MQVGDALGAADGPAATVGAPAAPGDVGPSPGAGASAGTLGDGDGESVAVVAGGADDGLPVHPQPGLAAIAGATRTTSATSLAGALTPVALPAKALPARVAADTGACAVPQPNAESMIAKPAKVTPSGAPVDRAKSCLGAGTLARAGR